MVPSQPRRKTRLGARLMADRATGYRTTQERQMDDLLDKYSALLPHKKRAEDLEKRIDKTLALIWSELERHPENDVLRLLETALSKQ